MLRRIASACALSLALVSTAAAQVVNGGFETGDLSGWTFSGSNCHDQVDGHANSGSYGFHVGPIRSICTLSQSIATTVGQQYNFSFWLQNQLGGTPNSFEALFGGVSEYGLTDWPAFPYTQHVFTVTATSATTSLEFKFQHDPDFWDLDNVDVSAVSQASTAPEPSAVFLLATGLAAIATIARRRRKA